MILYGDYVNNIILFYYYYQIYSSSPHSLLTNRKIFIQKKKNISAAKFCNHVIDNNIIIAIFEKSLTVVRSSTRDLHDLVTNIIDIP